MARKISFIRDTWDVHAITFTGSTGQRCTASSRVIVAEGIHDRFVAAVGERLKGVVVDDALQVRTRIGPVVDESQLKQDTDYIEIGQKEAPSSLRADTVEKVVVAVVAKF